MRGSDFVLSCESCFWRLEWTGIHWDRNWEGFIYLCWLWFLCLCLTFLRLRWFMRTLIVPLETSSTGRIWGFRLWSEISAAVTHTLIYVSALPGKDIFIKVMLPHSGSTRRKWSATERLSSPPRPPRALHLLQGDEWQPWTHRVRFHTRHIHNSPFILNILVAFM